MAKKTNNGKKGGLLDGPPHKEGGIKAVVAETGEPVELEGGEAIISKKATKKHHKQLSQINQSEGGNPIPPPENYKKGGVIQKMCPVGTEIQSLMFSKDKFTAEKSIAWAKKNDFKWRLPTRNIGTFNNSIIDETDNNFRIRQHSPDLYDKDSFRTIDLTGGVQGVIGCRKNKLAKGGTIKQQSPSTFSIKAPSHLCARNLKLYYVFLQEG